MNVKKEEKLDIAQNARPLHGSVPRACESVEGSIMRAAFSSVINGCHPCCIALILMDVNERYYVFSGGGW